MTTTVTITNPSHDVLVSTAEEGGTWKPKLIKKGENHTETIWLGKTIEIEEVKPE